jgi:hypothetical protein
MVPLCLTKSDTLHKAFLISKQAIPYQTLGGTYCPGGLTPKNRCIADSSKTNHKPWRSQPSPPYDNLAQTTSSMYDQNTTIILQDERVWVNSHLAGWKTRAMHSSLSHKITDHKSAQHLARWRTWTKTQHNSLAQKIIDHKIAQHLTRCRTATKLVVSQDNRPQVSSTSCKMEDLNNDSSYIKSNNSTIRLWLRG